MKTKSSASPLKTVAFHIYGANIAIQFTDDSTANTKIYG